MGDHRPRRVSNKSHQPSWKQKLRDNCFKRIQEDRKRLLWKMRLPTDPSLDEKEVMEATFRDIVSDELKKMDSSLNSTSASQVDDILWDYDAHYMDHQTTDSDCEDILLEMQRVFYEDLKAEQTRRENEAFGITWEEEEDNYLAQAAFENMRLNDDQVCQNVVWCPICKQGELQENHKLIFCNRCNFQLNRCDEVNLEIVRERLGEAHSEHLDRGCRLKPKFCMETRFNISALYIRCQTCSFFEIVI